MSAWNCRGHW